MVQPIVFDQVSFILFVVSSLGYHFFYIVLMRHHPSWSVRARMHQHRKSWVESVLKRGERIMAVQALRNLIMTNTFLASTMLLLVAFIANFVVVNPEGSPFAHPQQNWFYGATPTAVKGVILLILYAFAFVMFLTSLRTLNHLSILVGIEPEELRTTEERDPAQFISLKLNQVESMTTYGRRAVYFSLPVFAWFYSPWLFAMVTLAIWTFFVVTMDFVHPFSRMKAKAAETKKPGATPTPK